MRRTIAAAIAQEQQSHQLARLLEDFARRQGNRGDFNVAWTVNFVQQYIEHVPALLEATEAAARQAGLLQQVTPLLEVAEHYWFTSEDLIPDRLGLVGLSDDAYVTLSLVQAISALYAQQVGRPLLTLDLTQANRIVRWLIGEPGASQLDVIVAQALQGPLVQQVMAMLPSLGYTLQTPDPIWGNASIDEIVSTRLGAMGVF
jgi:uncharacterized membrane protein YkvA (DUF1232 family)